VLVREDLAFALAIILLGMLMMITRRNAVTQIVGFMSLEKWPRARRLGGKGMPLVVEFSTAFSILIAFYRLRKFRIPYPRALRHRGCGPRSIVFAASREIGSDQPAVRHSPDSRGCRRGAGADS